MRTLVAVISGGLALLALTPAGAAAAEPAEPETVSIRSSADGSLQPARFWSPPGGEAVPLLVYLHTWSGDYRQTLGDDCLAECRGRGWAWVAPDFRGPNRRPEAGGSDAAVADVLDAVAWAKARRPVGKVYLAGGSGGGHMALLLAGRHPEAWDAVSAWVPVTDLVAWHRDSERYRKDTEAVCGGPPGEATAAEYARRSPLTHLAAARGLPVAINVGARDGHGPQDTVPVTHSLRAFDLLAAANGRPEAAVGDELTGAIRASADVPERERYRGGPEPGWRVLLRREAGPAVLNVFDGGHDVLAGPAVRWLADH